MADDDPGDVAHEKFFEAVLVGHPLGRPIGGTPETIRAVPREAVVEHYHRTYVPAELVVTAAGSVEHEDVCERVLAALEAGGWETAPGATPAGRRLDAQHRAPGGAAGSAVAPRPTPTMPLGPLPATRLAVHRTTEQTHVVLGTQGLTVADDRRHALSVLSTVLGGGMSSRLFQEVRERRGLAYSTYSFASTYAEAGVFGLYAACTPQRVGDVVRVLHDELDRLAAHGISEEELVRGIGQLRGSLVLGMEDNGSRMTRLGRAEIVHGELLTLDAVLGRIAAVTAKEVRELAADLAARPRSLVVVGPVAETDLDALP